MSYNGSGTFVINSTGQPVVTGTVISSSTFNSLTADLGTGLSTAITKDGQTTTTAKIPFALGISAAVASNFAAGTVAAPSIYLSTDTGTGFYRIGANNNGYSVSGTKLLDFSSALFAITGAATVSTTLGVTGATTLSSTLAVTGATTLSSTLAAGATTITGAATVSTTLGVSGLLTASVGAQFAGQSTPASGAGVEVNYSGGVGNINAFNRTGSAWLPIVLGGLTADIKISGTTVLGVTAGAAAVTGTLGVTGIITGSSKVNVGGATGSRATTDGTNCINVATGTAPVGSQSESNCTFYNTAGEMRVMDGAGNATLLSPHDRVTNEWIYDSVDTRTGRRLLIQMEQLMKAINDKFGWDYVKDTA